jgi:hypothetical protein
VFADVAYSYTDTIEHEIFFWVPYKLLHLFLQVTSNHGILISDVCNFWSGSCLRSYDTRPETICPGG